MSRTIFVALCAVAIFAMAPFMYAEDNVPPNPVTDAHRELAIGMTLAEWQPIVEKHLGWTRPEKSEYFAEGSTERRVMWTWDVHTKCGPDEPRWHFHLDVVFVEDVIRSTMYFAECTKGVREETKVGLENPASWTDVEKTIDAAIAEHTRLSQQPGWVGQSLPAFIANKLKEKGLLNPEPKNPCRDLWNELAIGMPKDDFLKLAAKHGFDKSKVHVTESGKEEWGCVWRKYHQNDPVPPPPNAWQWQIMVDVEFSDEHVINAEYTPLTHRRPEEKK